MKKHAVDNSQVSGHLRRAQHRLAKSLGSVSDTDAFIQAALGAGACFLAIQTLRLPGIGGMITRWIPMAMFAALYSRLSRAPRH